MQTKLLHVCDHCLASLTSSAEARVLRPPPTIDRALQARQTTLRQSLRCIRGRTRGEETGLVSVLGFLRFLIQTNQKNKSESWSMRASGPKLGGLRIIRNPSVPQEKHWEQILTLQLSVRRVPQRAVSSAG